MEYRIIDKVQNKETLSAYVRWVMAEYRLTFHAVVKRSRGQISLGAVSDIVQERTTNPTVTTLKGLARGLGVPEEVVFAVARGVSYRTQKEEADQRLLSTTI